MVIDLLSLNKAEQYVFQVLEEFRGPKNSPLNISSLNKLTCLHSIYPEYQVLLDRYQTFSVFPVVHRESVEFSSIPTYFVINL